MEAVKQGDSIECNSAEVISRDIKRGAFVNLGTIGKCLTYNCKRNSRAIITKELSKEEKENKYNTEALDREGDSINGENITLYVKGFRPLKIQVINLTGRHKAQNSLTNVYSYALISLQFHNIRQINDPEQKD